jgi:hypothetical protein
MSENQMQDERGNWVDAVEEPYYPTWIDRIKHAFGLHCWIDRTARFNIAYRKIEICSICHKINKSL